MIEPWVLVDLRITKHKKALTIVRNNGLICILSDSVDQNALTRKLLVDRSLVYELEGSDDAFLRNLNSFTHRVLSELDLLFLNESIFIIQSELITNFLKACAKRVFFDREGLNLMDPQDYQDGMARFRSEVLEKWDSQAIHLAEHEMTVVLTYALSDGGLQITIQNNVEISPFEYERIQKRLAVDAHGVGIDAEFTGNIDLSEGGGLGLILITILLQNTGIGRKNLQFHADKNGTMMTLFVPLHVTRPVIERHLSERVIGRVEALPSFPENVRRLMDLCDSSAASLDDIATQIGRDPALAAQILKLAGSAGYITRNKNPTLLEAVHLVGLNQVKSFLLVAGVRTILSGLVSRERMAEIWEDSNRVSFFAGQLARENRELRETVMISGLLNDVGRIVIYSFTEDDFRRLQRLTGKENSEVQIVLEETTLGISFPEIGAMLGRKWNFPESILYAIRYQMRPLHVDESRESLVYPVYLARCMAEVLRGTQQFEYIEYRVLKYFGLLDRHAFNRRLGEMEERFKRVYSA